MPPCFAVIVSTVSTTRKFVNVLNYHRCFKLSLDLKTCLRNVSVKTFPFVKLELFLNHQHVFPIFSSSKIKCPIDCAVTNFRVVDAVLPITAKHVSI